MSFRVAKGVRLKIWCVMLRGFESHLIYQSVNCKRAKNNTQVEIRIQLKEQTFRCSVGGYHVGFSLPKHGFESRHRNKGMYFPWIQLMEQNGDSIRFCSSV